MSQYVTARITQMDGIDIGLYDYDRHNAVYYFIVNAEEQIYLRYGGRDEISPESYLNLESLELALKLGLEEHEKFKQGHLSAPEAATSYRPRDIALIKEEVTDRKRCVECHLIADYETQEKMELGTMNPIKDLFVSPDIKTIGIHLNVPKGLIVYRATGAVAAAGMQAGDLVTGINGTPVLTFGDLQYFYNKTDRSAKSITLDISRGGEPQTLEVSLPREWWWTDTYFRYWTAEAVVYFWTEPLSDDEKRELELPIDGFASRIVEVDPAAQVYMLHDMKEGDIVFEVDGQQSDPDTRYAERHIQLRKTVRDIMQVKYLRDGEVQEVKLYGHEQNFRKAAR